MPPQTLPDPRNKDLGAYYTEAVVARALCRWAMRGAEGHLLDPAFGGGVFLQAAAELAGEAGGWELSGVELDREVHRRTARAARGSGVDSRLVHADFFALTREKLPSMNAVVGNPPFIRFQRFTGQARARAVTRVREAGLALPPLAGSWVAFVAHATTFLAPAGRLAMVLPAELGHAPSARPLLDLLRLRFARVTLVWFRNSLFPHLDQETVLLLAEGFGHGPGLFRSLELPGSEALERPLPCSGDVPIDAQALINGATSLAHSVVEPEALRLYRRLAREGAAVRLGEIARVESGYVTGGNAYFHLLPEEARESQLPAEVLVPALFRSRGLTGLRFGSDEWRVAAQGGLAGYLVQVAGREDHPAVERFLERLRSAGIDRRYKARTRRPWYRIGRVAAPPLILAGMGLDRLPLVLNDGAVVVPNTFHAVTSATDCPAGAVAACWLTSLTDLSLELEGHGLGGGLLKLDPGEAADVLLTAPALLTGSEFERLEAIHVAKGLHAAREEADKLLLAGALGLREDEIQLLRRAAADLRARRRGNER